MILAGIDEAGLGPVLGPLVTACAALRVPANWTPSTPWEALAPAVGRKARRGGPPAVADSKEAYTAGGLPALEATLAAFCAALGQPAPTPSRRSAPLPPPHPCYAESRPSLPPAGPEVPAALHSAGAAMVRLETAPLHETGFNALIAAGMNKNELLLSRTALHITSLAEDYADEQMLIVVDKQGGRGRYLPFLTALFGGSWIDTLTEGLEESAYRVRRQGADITLRFCARADKHSFPTALASMAAKHAREQAMAQLNAWFGARVPGLAPTAGYPADAKRWLAALQPAPDSLMLPLVIRQR